MGRRGFWSLWGVFLVALSWRWIHFSELRGELLWAFEWTNGGTDGARALLQAVDPLHGAAVQLALGVLVALFVARLGLMWGGAAVGLCAGALYACYGPALIAESSARWVVWQSALVLVAVMALTGQMRAAWAGMALGWASGLGGAVLPVALAVAVWIRRHLPTSLRPFALGVAGGMAVALVAKGSEGMVPRPPWEWLDGARQFIRAAEWTSRFDPYLYVEGMSASRLMWNQGVGFPFGLLAPAGLWGFWQVGRLVPASPMRSLLLYVGWAAVAGAILYGGGPWERLVAVPFLSLAAVWAWSLTFAQRRSGAMAKALLTICALVAVAHADPLPDRARGTAATLYARGASYEVLSMPAHAVESYERAVDAGFAGAAAHERLGALYAESGEYARAASAYQRALAADSDDAVRVHLAQVYLLYERPLQAVEQYQHLLRASNRSDLLGLMGDAYLMLGQVDSAVVAYERLLVETPDSIRALYNLARVHEESGRADDALRAYEQLRARGTWRVEASWRAASLLMERKPADYEGAEALLIDALAADPDDEQVRWLLGRALIGLGRLAEAARVYEGLRSVDAEDYRSHFFLAKLYYRLGRKEDADESYAAYQMLKRQMEVKQSVEEDLNAVLRQLGE